VGTEIETDVNTLFEHIAEAVEYDAAPGHGPGMPGEQRRSCISSLRLLEELSVAIDTPLRDGIRKTVAWFRDH
jgi:UDP-glucose 4-epimerase